MKNWLWIIFLTVMAFSCLEDPECIRNGDTALVINFKKLSDGKADTVVLYKIAAGAADSIFYQQTPVDIRDTLNGSALLSVNPFANETLFTFYFESEEKILRVGYKTEARFISDECGSEQLQYDLEILETQFDSVRVVNKRLSTSRSTNIEIYN
jgi:hypothetical protein